MQEWKLADIGLEQLDNGGFIQARYVHDDGAHLAVSFDRPDDLEEISVAELIRRLDAQRDKLLGQA